MILSKYLISLEKNKSNGTVDKIMELNMDLLNSIDILIQNNFKSGIEELLRCYIETFFQLIFILDNPQLIEKRTLAYQYFFLKNKTDLPSINKVFPLYSSILTGA